MCMCCVYVRRVRHFCRWLTKDICFQFNVGVFFFARSHLFYRYYNIIYVCVVHNTNVTFAFYFFLSHCSDLCIPCARCIGMRWLLLRIFWKHLLFDFNFLMPRLFLFLPVLLLMMLAAMPSPPPHMTYVKTVSLKRGRREREKEKNLFWFNILYWVLLPLNHKRIQCQWIVWL